MPERPWRALALIMLGVVVALTAGWEAYWRGKGFLPGDFNNSNGQWAQERRKATGDATVLIGSSRIFFDIDLDIWEELTGVRPVQLALEGTSPRIFLADLAADEDFTGTVIVGVTTVLFFTGDGGLRGEVLKYVREQSPSQRFEYAVFAQLERVFGFLDEQTRPRRQVAIWSFPLREGMPPRFDPRKLEALTSDRNAKLWDRVVDDPVYQAEAKEQWTIGTRNNSPPPSPDGSPPPPMPDEAINAVIAEVKANIDRIRARGGDVAFLQLPYEGAYADVEDNAFPRERFWDRLLAGTDAVGVSFKDDPALQGYVLPEWSHLSASEARRYTRAVVPMLYGKMAENRGETDS